MKIKSVSVNSGGAGYTSAPAVACSGGGGKGAKFTAFLDGDCVERVNIDDAGTGYTTEPNLVFSGGEGNGASAVALLGPDDKAAAPDAAFDSTSRSVKHPNQPNPSSRSGADR